MKRSGISAARNIYIVRGANSAAQAPSGKVQAADLYPFAGHKLLSLLADVIRAITCFQICGPHWPTT